MGYSPDNIDVFNAAFSGALGGMFQSRGIVSPTESDYATYAAVAGTFAEDFDAEYNLDTSPQAIEIIQGVVANVFGSRNPISTTETDYDVTVHAIIAVVSAALTWLSGNTSGTDAIQPFRAKNIVLANQADLTAYTVAANASVNDNVLNVRGDIVLLVKQTAKEENGPYVVGTVSTGVAPLTRPYWWSAGTTFRSGIAVTVGGQGAVYKNTIWQSMKAANSFDVDDDDPVLYPQKISGRTALVNGSFTISAPIFSVKSGIALARSIANTSAGSVEYTATTGAGGSDGITAGVIGSGAVVITARLTDAGINTNDVSTISWLISNSQ